MLYRFYFLILLILIGCKDIEKVRCENEDEIILLKDTLTKILISNEEQFRRLGILEVDSFIEKYLDKYVTINLVRTTKVDNVLDRCNCSAQLKIKSIETNFKDSFPKEYESQIKLFFITKNFSKDIYAELNREKGIYLKTTDNIIINFDYALQKLKGGDLIIEYGNDFDLLTTMFVVHYWDLKLNGV